MSIPPIPEKYKYIPLYSIDKTKTDELFAFLVRRLCITGTAGEFTNHLQLSRRVFNETDSVYLKKISSEFGNYFEVKGQKKRIDLEKTFTEHPWIWTGEKSKSGKFDMHEIISSVLNEISETQKEESKNTLFIHQITLISKQEELYIYKAELLIEDDNIVTLSEGQQVKLFDKGGKIRYITILDFNIKEETIAFQCNTSVDAKAARIQSSSVFLLYKLKEALEALQPGSGPIWDIIQKKSFPQKIAFTGGIYTRNLDESQKACVEKVLQHNVGFIWGPPGTGKSHTLARILSNLYNSNESTLVCAVANVAIDGLMEKTIDLLKEYQQEKKYNLLKERKIIRIGYSQSEKVRNIPEIKFENQVLISMAAQIDIFNERIERIENSKTNFPGKEKQILELRSKRDKMKKSYDEALKRYIAESKLLFITASKFVTLAILRETEIDNLVVDEGSMMSIPNLMALAAKVKKRIIICGDPKQLGPIALSGSQYAKKWLHPDLFSLLKGNKSHNAQNAVSMLRFQRRSAREIAELINEPFYNGELITQHHESHDKASHFPPKQGKIAFITLPRDGSNQVSYSASRSKYNSLARIQILELLKTILAEYRNDIESIGIIAPYRQQINDYKRYLEYIDTGKVSVKVGTIHTFQGSECDIIIWDIVDAFNEPIGSLYRGNTGERLVNVAVSRAKSKLIIVGHNRIFHECTGGDLISIQIKKVMSAAWNYYCKNNV